MTCIYLCLIMICNNQIITLQSALLKRITLGHGKSDSYNRMIPLSELPFPINDFGFGNGTSCIMYHAKFQTCRIITLKSLLDFMSYSDSEIMPNDYEFLDHVICRVPCQIYDFLLCIVWNFVHELEIINRYKFQTCF